MKAFRPIQALLTTLFVLSSATSALADTKTKLASSGAWSLYRGTYYFVMEEGFIGLEPSCFAETGNDKAKLQFAMLPEGVNQDKSAMSSVVYLQAMADVWDFRRHSAALKIGDGNFNLTIMGTFYDGNYLMINMGGYGNPPPEFAAAAEAWTGTITLSDERNRKLGSFSAKGFKTIYAKLLKCGGK